MDSVLNNLQTLICLKTNQPTNKQTEHLNSNATGKKTSFDKYLFEKCNWVKFAQKIDTGSR